MKTIVNTTAAILLLAATAVNARPVDVIAYTMKDGVKSAFAAQWIIKDKLTGTTTHNVRFDADDGHNVVCVANVPGNAECKIFTVSANNTRFEFVLK